MPKELIEIEYKNKHGLLKCSPDLFKMIREKFSVKNPNWKQRRFNPRNYVITPSGAFQVGLWNEISHFINSLQIPVQIKVHADFKKVYTPPLGIKEISLIEGYNYYDYQEATLKEFVANGRGIGILATGAGKSLLAAGLCKTILDHKPDARILISVPNTALLNQLYDSFLDEFHFPDVTKWGDGNLPDFSKHVLIANNQILLSDETKTLRLLKDFDVVIIDEVHTLGTKKNKINKIIHNIETPHKFGLTGTLPDNMLSGWNVIGKVGPILYEKSSYQLREQQTISEVNIKVVIFKHKDNPAPVLPEDFGKPLAKYEKESDFIYTNPKRNKFISDLATKLDGNCLVLVDRIAHGQELARILKSTNKQVHFIQGSTDNDDRTMIKRLMEENNNVICIAMSKIFSVGISIKNLKYVIFCSIGKSNVKIMQSIGRSLRLHENKDMATIFDFADDLLYSLMHIKKRIKLYKEERMKYTTKIINL